MFLHIRTRFKTIKRVEAMKLYKVEFWYIDNIVMSLKVIKRSKIQIKLKTKREQKIFFFKKGSIFVGI